LSWSDDSPADDRTSRGVVADLAERRVDVVVRRASREYRREAGLPTTPIVMIVVQDPVEAGLVASLARPGGT